jgi:hypothetical protein
MKRYFVFASVVFLSCHDAPVMAPLHVVSVAAGTGMTAITATFSDPATLRFRNESCVAVTLHHGAEPPAQHAGRVEAWIAGGQILGHTDRSSEGMYQAAIRATLPAGTPIAASNSGGTDVAAHRFRKSVRVPQGIRRTAPGQGFSVRSGAGVLVRWEGGDSSHVSITLSFEPPQGTTGDGVLINCVVPRSPGNYTVTADALSRSHIPTQAQSLQVLVVPVDRVRDGDYALDATTLVSDSDQIFGTLSP